MAIAGILILIFLVQLANIFIISHFFLYPLAESIYFKNSKKAFFWISFCHICFIAISDLMGVKSAIIITILDISLDFIGALIIIPIISRYKRVDNKVISMKKHQEEIKKPTIKIICLKCGELLKVTDSMCSKCGASFSKDNIKIEEIK